MSEFILEARGISKSFGGLRALIDVDFTLKKGEVVGLVGDNGAGKSTLIKVLTGVHEPDTGKIILEGQEIRFRGRKHAKSLGIECVYQDLALVDSLNAPANVFLGSELCRTFLGMRFLANDLMKKEALRVLKERMSISLGKVDDEVLYLSGGQKQAVAITRAIYKDTTRVLVLDEPTAALGPEETDRVLSLVKTLSSQGMPIIVIAHNLEHVFDVSDRIVVLRRGQCAGVRETKKTTRKEVLGLIVGADEESVSYVEQQ